MPSVRQSVLAALRRGDVDGTSALTEVRGIGEYLAGRLQRGMRRPATVQSLWTTTRTKTTEQVVAFLYAALQNRRANQCVSPRTQTATSDTYHVGDINQAGYEACTALLQFARQRDPRVRYGALPRVLPRRSEASKVCGCLTDCSADPRCTTTRDGGCVPRASSARGFVGVGTHPGQREEATRAGTRNANGTVILHRTRNSPAIRNDPDSSQDMTRGHSRSLRYSPRGRTLWRRPGTKVRSPVRR